MPSPFWRSAVNLETPSVLCLHSALVSFFQLLIFPFVVSCSSCTACLPTVFYSSASFTKEPIYILCQKYLNCLTLMSLSVLFNPSSNASLFFFSSDIFLVCLHNHFWWTSVLSSYGKSEHLCSKTGALIIR